MLHLCLNLYYHVAYPVKSKIWHIALFVPFSTNCGQFWAAISIQMHLYMYTGKNGRTYKDAVVNSSFVEDMGLGFAI